MEKKQLNTKKVWIFSDSQAALKRLKNSKLKAGQYYVQSIKKWAKKFQESAIQLQLEWVPGHMNIKENELADKAAKKEAKLQHTTAESYISLAFIKRKIRESGLIEWNQICSVSKSKDKHYNQFECKLKWKTTARTKNKQNWFIYIQLKLEHEYFKSYLIRFHNYDSNTCCICKIKENPEHLLLHCRKYNSIRNKIKLKKQLTQLSLKILFNTKTEQDFLFEFLKQTNVATRKNLLQESN
jgi:RNase H